MRGFQAWLVYLPILPLFLLRGRTRGRKSKTGPSVATTLSPLGVSVLDLLVALSAMVADHGGSCGLRGLVSRLFAEVARVLDGCAFSCIQSPAVDASIQDLVRCSLTGSSGKRRRLDPHITGLASIKHNVSQAGLCASHAGALHSPDEAWHFTRPTTLAFHVRSTPVRTVRVSVCTLPCAAPMEAKQLKCCVSVHVMLPYHP